MKFPFIDILLKLFWFIVISKIIRFSRYRYYLLWNLAHCYIGIEIPFFYSIYSIFKFYLNTKNITIIIKRIKASVNTFAVLHWITASRFTKRTTSYSSLIRSSSSTTAYRFLQLKPKTGRNSWFEPYKQKHPQLLRSFTPNNCFAVYQNLLVLFLIQASHQPLLIASYTWSRGPPDAIKNYITLP